MKRFSLAAIMSAFIVSSSPALAFGSAKAEQDVPAFISGLLADPSDLTGVAVLLKDQSQKLSIGDTVRRATLIPDVEQKDSNYTLRLEPAKIEPAYFSDGGVVEAEIRFTSEAGAWFTHRSARLVSSGDGLAWVDPLEETVHSKVDLVDTRKGKAGVSLQAFAEDLPPSPQFLGSNNLVPMPKAMQPAGRAVVAAGGCMNLQYVSDSNRSTTIATSYPLSGSTSWLKVSRSKGGKFGWAVTSPSAGISAQGSYFTEGGWAATWSPSSVARSYRIQVNYHKYKVSCTDTHRWLPHIETGGATANTTNVTRPAWNTYCAPVGTGVTWERSNSSGHNYKYGQAVKFTSILGIDLSGEKSYNSTHTLYYKIGGTRAKRLCGNNDYPSMAGKIIERYR